MRRLLNENDFIDGLDGERQAAQRTNLFSNFQPFMTLYRRAQIDVKDACQEVRCLDENLSVARFSKFYDPGFPPGLFILNPDGVRGADEFMMRLIAVMQGSTSGPDHKFHPIFLSFSRITELD